MRDKGRSPSIISTKRSRKCKPNAIPKVLIQNPAEISDQESDEVADDEASELRQGNSLITQSALDEVIRKKDQEMKIRAIKDKKFYEAKMKKQVKYVRLLEKKIKKGIADQMKPKEESKYYQRMDDLEERYGHSSFKHSSNPHGHNQSYYKPLHSNKSSFSPNPPLNHYSQHSLEQENYIHILRLTNSLEDSNALISNTRDQVSELKLRIKMLEIALN